MPGDVLAGTQPVIQSESSASSIGSGNFQVSGMLEPDYQAGFGKIQQEIADEKDKQEHQEFYDQFGINLDNMSDEDKQLIEQLFQYYEKYKDTGDSAWYEKLFETIYNLQSTSSARKWEEEMSNTAFSRLVADIERAGYNPWIALQSGYGQASTPSVSAASSSNVSKSEQDTQRYAAKLNLIGQVLNGIFRMIGGLI